MKKASSCPKKTQTKACAPGKCNGEDSRIQNASIIAIIIRTHESPFATQIRSSHCSTKHFVKIVTIVIAYLHYFSFSFAISFCAFFYVFLNMQRWQQVSECIGCDSVTCASECECMRWCTSSCSKRILHFKISLNVNFRFAHLWACNAFYCCRWCNALSLHG